MGNIFGQLFRVTTFGESHGGGVGVVVDGCPPRIAISDADIQQERLANLDVIQRIALIVRCRNVHTCDWP